MMGLPTERLAQLSALVAEAPERMAVLELQPNRGKAEALRAAMLSAAETCHRVRYADADFASPPSEILRLLDIGLAGDWDFVVGSRVVLSAHDVHRTPMRHLFGRIFGTSASMILGRPFYDTQCGLKWFRNTPVLQRALSRPLSSRWYFDVELLGRLFLLASKVGGVAAHRSREEPLLVWHDIAGTKLRAADFVAVPRDLLRIRASLAAWSAES